MAYSLDLRLSAVAAYENSDRYIDEIAKLFSIGSATLVRWLRLKRETGEPKKRPWGGGNPYRIGTVGEVILLDLLKRNSDATLKELAFMYTQITKREIPNQTIWRTLDRLGLSYKKNTFC